MDLYMCLYPLQNTYIIYIQRLRNNQIFLIKYTVKYVRRVIYMKIVSIFLSLYICMYINNFLFIWGPICSFCHLYFNILSGT